MANGVRSASAEVARPVRTGPCPYRGRGCLKEVDTFRGGRHRLLGVRLHAQAWPRWQGRSVRRDSAIVWLRTTEAGTEAPSRLHGG